MAVSSDNLCEGQHTRYTFPWTTGRGPIMSGVPSIQAKPIYDMDEKGPKGALFLEPPMRFIQQSQISICNGSQT